MKRHTIALLSAAVLAVTSCTFTAPYYGLDDPDTLQEVRSELMTTFTEMNGSLLPRDGRSLTPFLTVQDGANSKATVPVWSATSYTLPDTVDTPVTGSVVNYPEPGQTTSWEIVKLTTANLYRVTATTTYPESDPRNSYVESYYIKSLDGNWTNADEVTDAAGQRNTKFRIVNRLTYDDGSVQNETIVYDMDTKPAFATFSLDGSLEYPAAFQPETDAGATWSSVSVYTRELEDAPSFSFWNGNRATYIIGARYYTERLVDGQLQADSVVFEKAVTALETLGGEYVDSTSALYLRELDRNPDQDYLALSVIRQRVVFEWNSAELKPGSALSRETRTRTRVVNIADQKDDYITIINSEAAELTKADTTIWIPDADDPDIVDLSSADTVSIKATNEVFTAEDSVPVNVVLGNMPTGYAGTLYYSISEGTALATDVGNDISGDLLDLAGSGSIVGSFDGEQGTVIPSSVAAGLDFSQRGTIGAWVYADSVSDFAGIAHAGIRSDFSDELWTLQLWYGKPAFGLAGHIGTQYTYDIVTANTKLKTGKWYFILATWDIAADYLKIYTNGRQPKTASFQNLTTSATFAVDPPIVIGSQHYDATYTLKEYYGWDGKINGVIADSEVWTADQIAAYYDENKNKTASW